MQRQLARHAVLPELGAPAGPQAGTMGPSHVSSHVRFRLLTYNIHRAIGIDRRFRPERIAKIIEHHDPDVVTLQEVDSGAPRSRMLDLAAHLASILRYDHWASGMNVFLRAGRYGNATLSRFPIAFHGNIDLALGAIIRRGALHTQVLVPLPPAEGRGAPAAVPLDVFNVHLSLTQRYRHRQLPHMLRHETLSKLCARSSACVVAGDTNDWRGTLRAAFLTPAGFHCATNRGVDSRWSLKTYPSFAPTAGLDKVFYRGPLRMLHTFRSRLRAARVASDHLPVVVDFELALGLAGDAQAHTVPEALGLGGR
jgi:endonuclease/exonuclease/phosphatase family metal-dependent hydrolase